MNTSLQTDVEHYLGAFEAFRGSLNGLGQGRLGALRQEAMRVFSSMGFPSTRSEEWRYTDLAPVASLAYALPPDGRRSDIDLSSVAPYINSEWTVVLVNGIFSPALSNLPAFTGLAVRSMSDSEGHGAQLLNLLGTEARLEGDALTSLNTAFFSDGVLIEVDDNCSVINPVNVVFLKTGSAEGAMVSPRLLVKVGRHAAVRLVEVHASAENVHSFSNAVSEILVGDGGRIDHCMVGLQGQSDYHVGSVFVRQGRDSQTSISSFCFGGALVRNNTSIVLDGSGSESVLNGLSVLDRRQHIDNHTCLDHSRPNCQSHEVYKGIYSGHSTGVFNGTIIVRPDAQKTNAIQANNALLLSDTASINSKPQLKIWADDVKCTHGATVGQLDEDAMFYIRSRGVSLSEARNMLVHAFASEVINKVETPALREALERRLIAALPV